MYVALWVTLELLNVIHNYRTKIKIEEGKTTPLKLESNNEQMSLIDSQVGGLSLLRGIMVSRCSAPFHYAQISAIAV